MSCMVTDVLTWFVLIIFTWNTVIRSCSLSMLSSDYVHSVCPHQIIFTVYIFIRSQSLCNYVLNRSCSLSMTSADHVRSVCPYWIRVIWYAVSGSCSLGMLSLDHVHLVCYHLIMFTWYVTE